MVKIPNIQLKIEHRKCIILLCICLLALGGCSKKQDAGGSADFQIDKDFQRGPLTVHLRLSKSSLTIAQTFLLQIESTIQDGYELTMPKIDPLLQTFGLLDFHDLGDRLDEENRLVKTYNYKFEPLVSGNFTIPPLTFNFTETKIGPVAEDAEPKQYTLDTEPIDIEVTSLLGEDLAELVIADIVPPVNLPYRVPLWPFVVIAVVIVAIAIIIFIRLRRKTAVAIARLFKPAHEIAYQRLKKLVAAKLIEKGQLGQFYQRISDILRHYIEDRFDLMAPERTTEEFLFELSQSDSLSQNDKDSLAEFLMHCDLVKFAKYQPETEQIQRTFDLVKNFIEKTKSAQHQIDITDAVYNQQTASAEDA
jgi:hypothetical protein